MAKLNSGDNNVKRANLVAALMFGIGAALIAAPQFFSAHQWSSAPASTSAPGSISAPGSTSGNTGPPPRLTPENSPRTAATADPYVPSSIEPGTDKAVFQPAKANDPSMPDPQKEVGAPDNANETSVKSWTSKDQPGGQDRRFLESLSWKTYRVGNYDLATGVIYGKWIAATQFSLNGKPVLTEYTPPAEYVTIVDPANGRAGIQPVASDPNHDGILEIVFLHQKLYDNNYHMYTVYALNSDSPKLIWKSGGALGDWLSATDDAKHSPVRVKLGVD